MYTKLTAPQIFNGYQFEPENAVLILKNGTVEEIVSITEAGDDVLHVEGILCPGFINAHCHTELSHLKNKIPKHTGLVDFVQQVLQLRNEDEEKQNAIADSIDYIKKTGTVVLGDICNTTDSIYAKKQSTVHFVNFIELSGFMDDFAEQRLAPMLGVQKQFEENGFTATLVPHAPYSVSETLFRRISEISLGKLISIHNQECEAENIFFETGEGQMNQLYKNLGINISLFKPSGKTSLQTWLPYFPNHKIISVHNTFISHSDLLASKHLSFCICMNANLYIENKLPPLQMLYDHSAHIVLGTDSLASNDSVNLYEEIKTIRKYFPFIAMETILKWATSNGAETLQVQEVYGSFTKGLRPGVVQIYNDTSRIIL